MTLKTFEPIVHPKKQLAEPTGVGYYRVYKDAKEFVRVEAATVAEALQKSGVTESFRIEMENIDMQAVLSGLTDKKEAAAAPKAEEKAEEKPKEESAPAPAAAAEPAEPAKT